MLRVLRNSLSQRVEVNVDKTVCANTIIRANDIVGIPVDNTLSGATVTFIQEGIVALTFSGQGTLGSGSYLYYDVSADALSVGAAVGDVEVGQIIGADPDGGSSVYLTRLKIGFPRAAAAGHQSSIAE